MPVPSLLPLVPPLTEDRAAFWRVHVDGWKSSGLSLRVYSERHGLNRGTLGYWSSRLRAAAQSASAAPAPLCVVPVQVAPEPPAPLGSDAGLALDLPGGVRVRIARGFDAATLGQLLAVVRS